MVSKSDLNPWASKVFPGEWDIGTNSNSTGFNFSFDPRFFHTAYEVIWHKTGMAWVVASNPVGELWHVASSVGEGQDDLFFRTQKPIPVSKIARWLILHGFDLYDSQWQRTVLPKDDDYNPPCPDADSKERPQPGEVFFLRDAQQFRIKIGYSTNSRKRVNNLRLMSSTPLDLVGRIPAPQWYERRLHKAFGEQRTHGEWFGESDELLELIAESTIP